MKNKILPQEARSGIGRLRNGGKACDPRMLPRCMAKAKSTGKRCGQVAMRGKKVCYIHGGKSPGAPRNNSHALKHGFYTSNQKQLRRQISQFMRECGKVIERI